MRACCDHAARTVDAQHGARGETSAIIAAMEPSPEVAPGAQNDGLGGWGGVPTWSIEVFGIRESRDGSVLSRYAGTLDAAAARASNVIMSVSSIANPQSERRLEVAGEG